MLWAHLLAYVTGTVNQELLLRNEYLAAENRILRGLIKGRLLLSEGEKATLAKIAHRLGRMVLEDVAATPKADTRLRRSVGRTIVDQEAERLVLQMAVRCRERLGGPAEALREGSGIGVDGA